MKVLVNGLGRIGKHVSRLLLESAEHSVVAINDINPSIENLSYLLQFDSQYGPLKQDLKVGLDKIICNSEHIRVSHYSEPEKVSLDGIDLVIESSGVSDVQRAWEKRIRSSDNVKLIITHTYSDADQTIIFGANDDALIKDFRVYSSSICDTSAIAPFVRFLEERCGGIEKGFVTTLHPWLGYQNLVDGPSRSFAYPGEIVENFTLGRASTEALIPKDTSCISAMRDILPDSFHKFESMSFRVPTPVVSCAKINVSMKESFDMKDLIARLKLFVGELLPGVMRVESRPLVSVDFKGDRFSSIVDERWLRLDQSGKELSAVLWYDNEYAYSCRVLDLIGHLDSK